MPNDPDLLSAGHAELVLKIGPDTKVFTDIDPDSASVVCIQAAEWQVLFYPFSDAEGMQSSQAEADRASEMVIAFSQWRNAIIENLTNEQSQQAATEPELAKAETTDQTSASEDGAEVQAGQS